MKNNCTPHILLLIGLLTSLTGATGHKTILPVSFAGKYGQLEIGGPFVGLEFHHSQPLPCRISFFYPVANSIDLSTDYWRRDASRPFRCILHHNGVVDSLSDEPWQYTYTPGSVSFVMRKPDVLYQIDYGFCKNLPAMVFQLFITNADTKSQKFQIDTELQCLLRTCQTYAEKRPTQTAYRLHRNGDYAVASFSSPATDSAAIFVSNVGAMPLTHRTDSAIAFHYEKRLEPGEQWNIIQVIGSCRQGETDKVILQASRNWRSEMDNYTRSIADYAKHGTGFQLPDSSLEQTAVWSKAVLAANQHFLNKELVAMPCPAEYNFFFTHDVLLTDLGAVHFDCERVKKDLFYISSLCKPDSILPHAHYWRDSGFQTEFCTSDNWNHLWFILLAGSYLRHSGDSATLTLLEPMLHKSLAMMLENKGPDNLMYAYRPDWWDIGHVYGARAYITTLMIRALREYVFIGLRLGFDERLLAGHGTLARQMQQAMIDKLWDPESGFLFNMTDTSTVDRHYYAGSLLAASWKILDGIKSERLLRTAGDQLLDRQLGIRIAMPADFHQWIERYRFNGMEAGAPYLYLNGGIWPHGTAWYALAWLAVDEADSAKEVLKKYLTLQGIQNSPNGQPSFYEYRNADVSSPRYGEIDKPTFLWAGGWYLHVLYRLAGLRENEWNLFFVPVLPQDWCNIQYDAIVQGKPVRVIYKGQGAYFKTIRADGQPLYSAVMFKPVATLELARGLPQTPYLAAANGIIDRVRFDHHEETLYIDITGFPGQEVELHIISPVPLYGGHDNRWRVATLRNGAIYEITIQTTLNKHIDGLAVQFNPERDQ
jgi:hypothetical protein